ncbi:hypothetical protein QBC42DRAFT_249995 [Cladorrhinum samala]|uniref:Uncharacterized protein n=1 Tax=Cladorrhinum samala TaxID=585594 RepID=A0AAV9HVY5_9PEZI|nr:hypothetical protein QBC42DRAFT_249995 [Cladorrhinum samala]
MAMDAGRGLGSRFSDSNGRVSTATVMTDTCSFSVSSSFDGALSSGKAPTKRPTSRWLKGRGAAVKKESAGSGISLSNEKGEGGQAQPDCTKSFYSPSTGPSSTTSINTTTGLFCCSADVPVERESESCSESDRSSWEKEHSAPPQHDRCGKEGKHLRLKGKNCVARKESLPPYPCPPLAHATAALGNKLEVELKICGALTLTNMVDITGNEPNIDTAVDARQHTSTSSLASEKNIASSSSSDSSSSLGLLAQLSKADNNISNLAAARFSDRPCSPVQSQTSNPALSTSSLPFADTTPSRECCCYVPSLLRLRNESVYGNSSSEEGVAGSEKTSLDPYKKVHGDTITCVYISCNQESSPSGHSRQLSSSSESLVCGTDFHPLSSPLQGDQLDSRECLPVSNHSDTIVLVSPLPYSTSMILPTSSSRKTHPLIRSASISAPAPKSTIASPSSSTRSRTRLESLGSRTAFAGDSATSSSQTRTNFLSSSFSLHAENKKPTPSSPATQEAKTTTITTTAFNGLQSSPAFALPSGLPDFIDVEDFNRSTHPTRFFSFFFVIFNFKQHIVPCWMSYIFSFLAAFEFFCPPFGFFRFFLGLLSLNLGVFRFSVQTSSQYSTSARSSSADLIKLFIPAHLFFSPAPSIFFFASSFFLSVSGFIRFAVGFSRANFINRILRFAASLLCLAPYYFVFSPKA